MYYYVFRENFLSQGFISPSQSQILILKRNVLTSLVRVGQSILFQHFSFTYVYHIPLGPLIESISCNFRSRTECEDWHEKILEQIRSSRQSTVLPSKLSVQPTPPPHVSHSSSPPFSALTGWIREMISADRLTHHQVRSLQKYDIKPCSHRVESTMNTEFSSSSPVLLIEPNPFGYIHYMPSCSSNESKINLLVGREDVTSIVPEEVSSAGNAYSSELVPSKYQAQWGRRLPFNNQLSVDKRFSIASDGFKRDRDYADNNDTARIIVSDPPIGRLTRKEKRKKYEKKKGITLRKEDSPPYWISCFPSQKNKYNKFHDDVQSKSSFHTKKNKSSMKFIDRTPSADSFNLPYCSPVKLDYENFSRVDLLKGSKQEFHREKSSSCENDNTPIPNQWSEYLKEKAELSSSQLIAIPLFEQPSLICHDRKPPGDIILSKTDSHKNFPENHEEDRVVSEKSQASNICARTKQIFKTGLYAHWWLNASLPPISDEV